MSDLTLTWAEVHACLAAKYGKRAFDALDDLLCASFGLAGMNQTAADEIMRLRAVLDAIDAQHTSFTEDGGEFCHECLLAWPCPTHLLINPVASSSQSNLHDRPTTVDEAIDTLGAVHK